MNNVHEQLLKQCTTQFTVSHCEKSVAINNSIVHVVLSRARAQRSVACVVPYRNKLAARAVFVFCCDTDELRRDMGSSYHD